MTERKTKKFTPNQMDEIRTICRVKSETDELCLFILLLLETNLRPRELLGWFNRDPEQRKQYLKDKYFLPMGPLFTKKHHAYLSRFKRTVEKWLRVKNASLEMLIRSK
ncbi:hypothetical protein AVEN_34101-1 [Araneus ventricosus]|uniref:Tyr recombinase domain-containing protein n=1 Tax=Araneus ventricosus TaxID=182803 RepID=A0A4Y2W7S1_ARAVE|nr:hypothetical protein AVEN_34101-1 [Araneus ventricosus]